MTLEHMGYLFRGWFPTWCMHLRAFQTADWILLASFMFAALWTLKTCFGKR
jgi:hypothetical protein